MKILISFLFLLPAMTPPVISASEDHDHHEEHENHGDHDDHKEGDDHAHEEHEDEGFKLSSEAMKTMGVQLKTHLGGSLALKKTAIVAVKDEKSVFRYRSGAFQRVPVKVLSRTGDNVVVSSDELKTGDQVAVDGGGFLRITEVFSKEGASHGHSH